MPRRVLGLIFLNAHRALYGAAVMYCDALRSKGCNAELIDLTDPENIAELDRILHPEQVAFCFAPQGVGSRLMADGETVWKKRGVPFVGIHGDNPCYNIFNHFSDTCLVANMYLYDSFIDIHNRYLGTGQVVERLPFQTGDIGPSPTPYRERPIRLLYLKAGESVAECVSHLNSIQQPLRDDIWQQVHRAERAPNFIVCDLVQEIFDQRRLSRIEQFDFFWGIVHWMDMYLRRKRAADFVDWLKMQEGAVIVGNGWDFIDKTGAKAVFRPSVPITETVPLYRQSQIICNTTPYGSDIIHERACLGLINQSIVINDRNAWWDKNFADIPALVPFKWGAPLEDQLQPLLALSPTAAEERSATGRSHALSHFAGHDLGQKILECVAKVAPGALD